MFCVSLVSVFIVCVSGSYLRRYKMHDKIVGGENTSIEDHPYQISLELYAMHQCGGFIIRPDVVVTAAHCTEYKWSMKRMTIRAGSSTLDKGGVLVHIKSICSHPQYDSETLDYDVSVLHLSKPLTFSPEIQAITLQPANMEVPTGVMGFVTGWGAIYENGPISDHLLAVSVPKISQEQCTKYYNQDVLTDRMHCFGYDKGEKDACQADSGGPLVVDGVLVGIVSWGYGCAHAKYPGVYTKVSNPEIRKHIQSCVDNFKRKRLKPF